MSAPPTDVADRLERLAAHAPVGGVDPDATWSQGRRRQRIRSAAVGATVVVVALLVASTTPLLVQHAQRVEPAGVEDRMVLPDVVRQPGAWEPAFETIPARLSAVGTGVRDGLWSSRNAWWGVSAATGESRFLDLPDAAVNVGGEPALSADGRRLAYWVAGEVSGTPIVPGAPDSDDPPVVGVAVLDLATGERDVWEVPSEHGLWAGGLAWAGDVLWWSAGPVRQEANTAYSARARARTWDMGTGAREEPAGPARWVSPDNAGDAPDGFVQRPGSLELTIVEGDREPRTVRVALPDGTPSDAGVSDPAASTDGARLAVLMLPDASQYDDAPKAVLVGDASGQTVTVHAVGDATAQAILGWRSATDLVVAELAELEDGRPERVNRAWSLDVTTGERSPLLDFTGNTPEVAADAWTAEVVPAPDAPFAPDPRLVGAGGAVVLVFLVSLWRDRRRRSGHP